MTTITQKRDPRRTPLPYQTNLRLSDAAYRGALMLAHSRGVSVAQVVRDALDTELERFTTEGGQTFLAALGENPSLDLSADELYEQLTQVENGSSHS